MNKNASLKNVRNMLKAAMIIALVFAFGSQLLAQEKKSRKLSGGMGYFMTGYSLNDYSGINSLLKTNGYPEMKEGGVAFGGGGHFINNNVIIGGEGNGLTGSLTKNSTYQVKSSTGYGFFNMGYMLVHKNKFLMYPMMGLGGGGTTIAITLLEDAPATFQYLLEDPGRESYINTGGFLMNFSLNANLIVLGGGSDKGTGGLMAGIRLGYILDPATNSWKFNENKLSGSPDSGLSGFYFRITIGGGGYVAK
jgi:hypothetical protein